MSPGVPSFHGRMDATRRVALPSTLMGTSDEPLSVRQSRDPPLDWQVDCRPP